MIQPKWPLLLFTLPAISSGDWLDLTKSSTVEWSSESSDPSYIAISLTNEDRALSRDVTVAENVSTSDESYTFDSVTALPGSGYVIKLKSPDDGNIEAQSGDFIVVKPGDSNVTNNGSTTHEDEDNAAGRAGIYPTLGLFLTLFMAGFNVL
ncbi:GPI anchored serine-threonine rich family protein [Aspergillus puulaauensis]|uniref:Yeast cell wall synthesis Kre9/Knh1-like N-terminal domain-containing protein n=1 Tax=Aspergillus puulaauensis TaxID=1220207 RepID=A0A7R7XUE4_9EURO|nr:uncharacterized protein APUU_60804S [Aspergillus puulaauensis]BCS27756.1 hypothetical protein APUU_60804S [Aspergillus puulaauensis]